MPRHPDLDALLNDLLPFAERMLAEHSEFYPFGGSITSDGQHISVGAKGSSDQPKSRELIDIMTNEFRSQASEGKIRAAGICFDVRVIPPGQIDKTDAIQLAFLGPALNRPRFRSRRVASGDENFVSPGSC